MFQRKMNHLQINLKSFTRSKMAKKNNNNNNNKEEPIEKQLWKAADKLRKNIDAAGE